MARGDRRYRADLRHQISFRRSESLSESVFKVEHPLVAEYRKITESRKEDPLPSHFVTAHTIAPEKRVLMQAALQKHIDQAISSTINLPKDTPVETIENIYRKAWKQGLKGITVYREGSRRGSGDRGAGEKGKP